MASQTLLTTPALVRKAADRATESLGLVEAPADARRCLDLYVAVLAATGDEANARHWLHTFNHHLDACPAELVRTDAGLLEVLAYLTRLLHR